MADESIMPLVIEKGKIKIDINNSGVTIKGTPLNEKFNDFVVKKNSLDDQAYEVERLESRMIMDGKNPLEIQQEITAQRKALSGKMDSLTINFIEDNYENVLGPGLFIMICNGLPYPVLTPMMEQILKNVSRVVQEQSAYKELRQRGPCQYGEASKRQLITSTRFV